MRRLVLLVLALALAPSVRAAARQGPWNVVLVVLDAVRADHTTPYGYGRDTTPALAELARQGAVFDSCMAQSDWTLPGFASIFTGRRPAAHGVFWPGDRLGGSEPHLAELFRGRGFRTAAFTAAIVHEKGYGLGRGFDTLEGYQRQSQIGSLDQTMPPALRWLESNARRPFFLLIHGGDAHYPYVCPQPYLRRFSSEGPDPAAGLVINEAFLRSFNFEAALDWKYVPWELFRRVQEVKASSAALAGLRAQYDGCLSYGDSVLASLPPALKRLGLWDRTILVVAADHGEELGERGGFGHYSRPLYEEVAHIPLVVRHPGLPGLAGRRVAEPVEQIDLLPTLMDWEGWPAPPQAQGRSLRPLLEGGPVSGDRPGPYAQAAGRGADRVFDLEAYRSGDWKIVRRGTRWELFDLAADPGESRDLSAREPARLLRLAEDLMRLKTRP